MDHLIGFDALSATLIHIRSNARVAYICTAAPLNYGEVEGYKLGKKTISSGNFTGPEEYYGDPDSEVDSGPAAILHVLQVNNIQMSADGLSHYVALVGGNQLLVVAPCIEMELEYGYKVNMQEWCIRVRQPIQDCIEFGDEES